MKGSIVLCIALSMILPAVTGSVVRAQQQPTAVAASEPRIVDDKLNEGEQILRRLEWFFSSRRPGTSSGTEMATLRASGAEKTREMIQAQSARTSLGIDAEQNFWVSKGPSPSNFGGWTFGTVAGRLSSLAADWAGGNLYVGSASGGLWKSSNDGLSWTSLFDTAGTMTIGTVAVDPNDPNVIWAGTGENNQGCESYFGIGLLRSGDGGLTWESRNGTGGATLEDLSSFADLAIDPRDSDHLVTGGRIRGCSSGSSTSGGIYTSNDGGLTWTKRLDNTNVYEIVQDPTVQDTFWAATSAGVYKSTDNGVTWQLQTASGLPSGGTGRTELAIAPSDSQTVYALFQSPSELWRTTDGGGTWSLRASGGSACDGQCSYNMVLRVHRTDPDTVIRGTVHVFRSVDGGSNWTDLSNGWGSSQKVHQDTHVLLMDPNDPNTFYVGSDGGLWKTTDLGNTFQNRIGNLNLTQFYAIGVDALDPETICGGAQDNSSLARTTSDVWDLQIVTGDGFVCHFDPIDPNYAYVTSYPSGGYPSIYRSTSGVFGSFSRVTGSGSGISVNDRINWVTPYVLDPKNPATLYLGTHRVYRSDDHGSNWFQAGPDDLTGGSGSLKVLEINRNFTELLYSGSASGKVWRTADGGANWTDITTGLPNRGINDVGSDPTNPDRAFAVVGGFNTSHVWEWNLGQGWVERGTDLPNVPANTVLMLTADDLLVGTDTGIFRSSDGGVTFQPYMNGLPEGLVVTDLKHNLTQNIVTAGTYGRGAWQVTIDSIGPIVIYDSVELPLIEVDGDGDGNVEPGESWSVRPIVRNAGSETAMGVQAGLATSTPGINVLEPSVRSYGDVPTGGTALPASGYEFTVDPSFACGDAIGFDIVNVTSTNPPGIYGNRSGAFSATVVDGYSPPTYTTLLAENFDSGSPPEWSHRTFDPNISQCWGRIYRDEWKIETKDAAHGPSYHCGTGPGGTYAPTDYSWLHHGGRDSLGGQGLQIPASAFAVSMTIVHWYDTQVAGDGGQVVIDSVADGQDVYSPLEPSGGYPWGVLATGECNGLEGNETFNGSSGGWITSTFDLTQYKGKTVWLAMVFGSDEKLWDNGEGWYVDQVTVETEELGDPICQVIRWPGTVPTASFQVTGGDDVEASWADSCNIGEVPTQGYSIQAGDLDSLSNTGEYDHAPIGGQCAYSSPTTFTPGGGNEYYLVVPAEGGREGGAGLDSALAARPQPSAVCGERRVEACP